MCLSFLAALLISAQRVSRSAPIFQQPTQAQSNSPASQQPPIPQKQAEAGKQDPFGNTMPVPSGAGVVVCAPIPSSPDAALAEFGDGCGRLIQWHLSNYGELGKMPFMDRMFETMKNTKLPNLRLQEKQALAFGKAMGVTHVAVGTLTGDLKQCVLTYRLTALAAGNATGEATRLSGTPEEIAGQLPQMIQMLAKQLGVTSHAKPFLTRLSREDIRAIGHYDWTELADIPRTEAARLAQAGAHDSLAAFMVRSKSLWMSDAEEAKAQAVLDEAAPHHLLLLAELVTAMSTPPKKYATQIQTFHDMYPNNFIMSIMLSRLERSLGDRNAEQNAAHLAMECAIDNPQSWMTMAQTLSNQASEYRGGRVIGDMSANELVTVQVIYGQWASALAHALALAPENGRIWRSFAEAATFLGDAETATRAYGVALKLQPDLFETLYWGTEMFQPKWFGKPEEMAKVLKAIQSAHFPVAEYALQMAAHLREMEQSGLLNPSEKISSKVVANFLRQSEEQRKRTPHSVLYYRNLTTLYTTMGRKKEAIALYKEWLANGPKRAAVQHLLDELLQTSSLPGNKLRN